MNAHRRSKIPACALVGVIASIDELRLATRMRAPPDLFELRLDHLPNLRESQLLKLRRPLIITARHPAEGGKKLRSGRRNLIGAREVFLSSRTRWRHAHMSAIHVVPGLHGVHGI